VRARIVPEFGDARMTLERGLHETALNAAPAPVDEPHLAQTGGGRRRHEFDDDRRDVARREGMQVDLVFDRDAQSVKGRVVIHRRMP